MSNSHSGLCPKTNSFAPLLIINGENFYFHDPYGNRLTEDYSEYDPVNPYHNTVNNPAIGYNELSEQLVKSTRNANGQVVAQKINRRLNKFDGLTWPYLSRYDVNWLKKQIAKFECEIWYWDDEYEQFIKRKFYWGDFSATPCEWETIKYTAGGNYLYAKRPIWYRDVKCNLIDMRLLIPISN